MARGCTEMRVGPDGNLVVAVPVQCASCRFVGDDKDTLMYRNATGSRWQSCRRGSRRVQKLDLISSLLERDSLPSDTLHARAPFWTHFNLWLLPWLAG